MAASEKLKEQLQLVTDLLGPQTQFVPAYTNNPRSHDSTSTRLNAQQLLLQLENRKEFSNYKIVVDTPTSLEDHCLICIDYDDHDHSQGISVSRQRQELHRRFSLDPTYAVKTPTGEGVHEYYLMPIEEAKKINKWHSKLDLPDFRNVEIKIGLPGVKTGYPGPGTYVKEKDAFYQVLEKKPPQVISESLTRHLIELRRHEIETFIPLTGVDPEIDTDINIRNMLALLGEKTASYVAGNKDPIIGDRNNKIYQLARDCFKYNVSKQIVLDSLSRFVNDSPKVFLFPLDRDEFEATINSAYNSVVEAKQYHDKSVDKNLAPYEKDEYGNHVIEYESYVKKTQFLSGYQIPVILGDERLRSMFCELVVFFENEYYVPSIEPVSYLQERYEEELKNTLELDSIFDAESVIEQLTMTSLNWKKYSPKDFKETFRFVINPKSSTLAPLASWAKFQQLSISLRPFGLHSVYTPIFNKQFIFDGRRFFLAKSPAIRPLAPNEIQPTQAEISKIEKYLHDRLSTIVDPNFYEEESRFVLSRMALLVKKPNIRLENVLVVKGYEGSGKSVFFNLFRPLMHSSLSKFFASLAQAFEGNFGDPAFYTHIDDSATSDINNKVEQSIKNKVTSPTQSVERKGVDTVEETRSINVSMTTNNEITSDQMISGRRWSIINNQVVPDKAKIRNQIREMLIDLYADNFRLYRVLATYIYNYDTSSFTPNYKSHWQLTEKSKFAYGDAPTARLLSVIVNYGFYPPEEKGGTPIQIIKEGEELHVTDLNRLFFANDKKKAKTRTRTNIASVFVDSKNLEAKNRIKVEFEKYSPKIITSKPSKTQPMQYGNHRMSPSIKDLIRLLAVYLYGSAEENLVKLVINEYGLQKHWDWDGVTMPAEENLGNIDPFAYVDPDEFEDKNDEDEF